LALVALRRWQLWALHAAVGLVCLLGAVHLLIALHRGDSAHAWISDSTLASIMRIIGGVEIIAVVLFWIPRTAGVGRGLLMADLAAAIVFHLAVGEGFRATLVIYILAVALTPVALPVTTDTRAAS
jgi:hypothetical protein